MAFSSLLGDRAGGAEHLLLGGEVFFGLRVEGRVHDEGVDKHVGVESDAGKIRATGRLGNGGRIHFAHVVGELLSVFQATRAVGGFDDELCGENVGKLGTKTVSATSCLGLVIIKVTSGQEIAKDQLWNVNSVLLMNGDGDTVTVASHAEIVLLLSYCYYVL